MTDEFWKPCLINNDPIETKLWKARKHARPPGQVLCTRCPTYTYCGPERFLGCAYRYLSVGHGSTLGRNFIPIDIGRVKYCFCGHKNYIATIKNEYAESYRNLVGSEKKLASNINELKIGTIVNYPLASHATNGVIARSYKRYPNISNCVITNASTQSDAKSSFKKFRTITEIENKDIKTKVKEGSMEMKSFFEEVKQINEKYKKESRTKNKSIYPRQRKPKNSKSYVIVRNEQISDSVDEKTLESMIDPCDWLWTPSSWRITRPIAIGSSSEISVDDPWIDEEKEMLRNEQKLCFQDAD